MGFLCFNQILKYLQFKCDIFSNLLNLGYLNIITKNIFICYLKITTSHTSVNRYNEFILFKVSFNHFNTDVAKRTKMNEICPIYFHLFLCFFFSMVVNARVPIMKYHLGKMQSTFVRPYFITKELLINTDQ